MRLKLWGLTLCNYLLLLLSAAKESNIAIHGQSISAMFGLYLCEGTVRNFEEAIDQ